MNALAKSAIILLLFFVNIKSQNIYFCTGHTSSGVPINPTNTLKIEPSGSYIFILLKNYQKLKPQLFYMFIDKRNNNSYEPFDSKVIRLFKNKYWLAYNYKFVEPGKYKVYFLDSQQKKIAQDTLRVKLKEKYLNGRIIATSDYYSNCEFLFCEIVLGGKPVHIRQTAYLKKNKGLMFGYLDNGTPLNTSKIIVDIWLKNKETGDYDELYETKKFKIVPEWSFTYFRYFFKKPGEYKFSVYNEENVLIKSAFITVY